MIKHGRSPWLVEFPRSRVPNYPRQRNKTETAVAVVGGGLTGCATAYAFAAAGVKVALVEAVQIGRGATAFSAGFLAEEPGAHFGDLVKALGLRATRHAWQSWRRAALDAAALLRRLEIKCHLEQPGTVTITQTPEQVSHLRRDLKVRREAGVESPILNAKTLRSELGVDAVAGLRNKESGTLDPYRACLGLAAAAAERGAAVFERSPVKRIKFGRKSVQLFLADGSILAERVVVATGRPSSLLGALKRHFHYRTTYAAVTDRIPAKIRQQLGEEQTSIRDSASPPHLLRWVGEDRLLVTGADSDEVPRRQLPATMVQRTGQLMYELSTIYPEMSGIMAEYGWAVDHARTADGLPCIGPHRNYPRHLFAFGDTSPSVTGSFLASRILLRHHLEDSVSADDVFGFGRCLDRS
jgi:glycine/D-amino acid oxidase-like deaminating enzyme